MKPFWTAGIAACSAVLSFPLRIHAQFIENQNITLRFFPNTQGDSCDYSNSGSAVTFTTFSIPIVSHCFNIADLFGGNATQGFVNQTRNSGSSFGEAGIRWQLQNAEKFDPQANYSRILYRQHVAGRTSDAYKVGNYADRGVTLYGGKDCSELNSSANDRTAPLLPWYGFSCWSGSNGSCGTLPYSVASFNLQSSRNKNKDGTCWVFAKLGAAPAASSSQVSKGAIFSAFLVAFMAL